MLWNSRLPPNPLNPNNYTYPAASHAHPHAPIDAGSRTYSYDANGNATSNGVSSYVWDGENRLLSVTISGAATSFAYAPDGTRLKKVTSTGTTIYLGPDIEISPTGVFTKYPVADAVRVGTGASPVTTWLHRDHLNSIRMRTDFAGTRIEAGFYWAYGEPASTSANPQLTTSRRYIGEKYDGSTGLYYLNGRYGDPYLARFISPDWWDPTARGGRTLRHPLQPHASPHHHRSMSDSTDAAITETPIPWPAIAGIIATVSVFAISQGLTYPLLSVILERLGRRRA